MIKTYYVTSGRSSTETFKYTHKQSKEQFVQAKQSKNKEVGKQAKYMIFHRCVS